MPWRARLRWSWIDFRRSCRLCIRCLKLLGRSLIGSRLQARPSPSDRSGCRPARGRLVPPETCGYCTDALIGRTIVRRPSAKQERAGTTGGSHKRRRSCAGSEDEAS
jgi:hypothetical protein